MKTHGRPSSQKNSMTWMQYRDADHKLSERFDISSIPHYFTIDSDGVLTAEMVGSGSNVEGRLKKLLARARESQPAKPAVVAAEDHQNGAPKNLGREARLWPGLHIWRMRFSIQLRDRPAKQVREQRRLNQYSLNRGSARIYSSVCYVRQSGKPKELRLNPTVYDGFTCASSHGPVGRSF